MSTLSKPNDTEEIPVLQQPAADTINEDLLDELDVPILTTPAESSAPENS